MSQKNKIGARIKLFRESRNLTIEDIAERSGLALGEVKAIENGDLIPGLTPLIKIARVLCVSLGTFLDDVENIGPVVNRKNEEKEVNRFSEKENAQTSDLNFFSLAQNKTGRHMEPFVIDVLPGSSKDFHLSTHEGEEFIFVLKGKIEVIYGKDKYELSAGDSIYYDSIVHHHLHAAEDAPAKILAVVYTPA